MLASITYVLRRENRLIVVGAHARSHNSSGRRLEDLPIDSRAMRDGLLEQPYWWEASPRSEPPVTELPKKADVLIVGSGYTGLSAALTLARAGREVVIVEREVPGWGASSRNQGHLGGAFRRGFGALSKVHGRSRAVRIFREGQTAVEFCKALIEDEGISCHLDKRGRLKLAWSPAHYETLAEETRQLVAAGVLEADLLSRDEIREQVASDRYQGGAIAHREATLHGALFHRGLLQRVTEAGVTVCSRTAVEQITGASPSFSVHTSRGTLTARDIVVATNGYTGRCTQALARRVVPVRSFGIATEPLSDAQIDAVLPGRRACTDSLKLSHGFRIAPGENRIIFGTRPPYRETNPGRGAVHLRAQMLRVFPQLEGVRITHAWEGNVAFSFDFLPHFGSRDGLHYALGYGGSGVAMAPYLGHKIARRVLGERDGESVLAEIPFETRPFYTGRPWFLDVMLRYYRWVDERAA